MRVEGNLRHPCSKPGVHFPKLLHYLRKLIMGVVIRRPDATLASLTTPGNCSIASTMQ